MKEMLHQMHNSDNFADVTLICDDKIQIKAHRHVLSVCSPVFKNLFTDEIDNHPVILLPGIQYSEMQTIMQFMYLGEAKCFDESMNQLLSAAKSLDIQEFANSVVIESELENENNHNKAQSKDMNLLPESKHVPNNNETCNQCGYQARLPKALKYHIQSKHQGLRHACLQCGQQLTTKSGLNNHVKAVHESLNKCEVCNIEYSSKSVLIRHIKSGHKYGRNNRKV